MQQHLGRLEGVSRVDVKLADGEVTIYPKEDSLIDPALVFKATYDSGVSVTEISITAAGRIEHDAGGRLVFRISNRQAFEIAPNEISKSLEAADAAEVSLRGVLFRKPAGKGSPKTIGPIRLEIVEVDPK